MPLTLRSERRIGANGTAPAGIAAPRVNDFRGMNRQAHRARRDQNDQFVIGQRIAPRAESVADARKPRSVVSVIDELQVVGPEASRAIGASR